jgi:hypothetical protein
MSDGSREAGDSVRSSFGQWQPIETAPKDEKEVILFYRWYLDGGFVTAGYFHVSHEGGESYWYADLVNSGASPPTHWMPLPSPPDSKKG